MVGANVECPVAGEAALFSDSEDNGWVAFDFYARGDASNAALTAEVTCDVPTVSLFE